MHRHSDITSHLPTVPDADSAWATGVTQAQNDTKWQEYDQDIISIVNEYNIHLRNTPGYVPLDWHVVKAILFVESGAATKYWQSRPMQIGNVGDKGLPALMTSGDKLAQIVPPNLLAHLTSTSAVSNGRMNIVAGVGYLLFRAAKWDQGTLILGHKILTVTVKSGDSEYSIAKAVGTTVPLLAELNPSVTNSNLKPGTVLRYKKAKISDVILGWRDLTDYEIAVLYNGKDIHNYTIKLGFARSLIKKKKLPSLYQPASEDVS